ncbi:MAG: hypothetical protein KBD24_03300 [Candidatus Pacebacteria bacterium]|nr:hypothetical protein [Candidatus Paceibacterota bacterium]
MNKKHVGITLLSIIATPLVAIVVNVLLGEIISLSMFEDDIYLRLLYITLVLLGGVGFNLASCRYTTSELLWGIVPLGTLALIGVGTGSMEFILMTGSFLLFFLAGIFSARFLIRQRQHVT